MIAGLFTSLFLGLLLLVGLGYLTERTGAGKGLASLGQGLSALLSPQIHPSFVPEVGFKIVNPFSPSQTKPQAYDHASGGAPLITPMAYDNSFAEKKLLKTNARLYAI